MLLVRPFFWPRRDSLQAAGSNHYTFVGAILCLIYSFYLIDTHHNTHQLHSTGFFARTGEPPLHPFPESRVAAAAPIGNGMQNVKKLLNLKPWLTIPDAARRLSVSFGEDVTEADVLRLGLDGHLTLSVNFVNYAMGCPGRIVPMADANPRTVPSLCGKFLVELFDGLLIGDDRVLKLDPRIVKIAGTWNLLMQGAERLNIEDRYQFLTSGPLVELINLSGPIVWQPGGAYCQLQTRFSKDERPRPKDPLSPEELLNSFSDPSNYYPAHRLPDDSVLVVRTSALQELEARLVEPAGGAEKPVERRERATLLVVIAALAKMAKIDVTKPSAAALAIESQTALMGSRVASRNIENHLNRIPEALENRESK